jgi:Helitron helicase-like domain at N-terminus
MRRTRWKAPRWRRTCAKCRAFLLDGESVTFCCNKGKWFPPPLPALPPSIENVIENSPSRNTLSSRSRCLNNLFCFTALGATQHFQHFATGLASVAITGRTYHRLFDITDNTHSLHWYLYDSLDRRQHAETLNVPNDWTSAIDNALQSVNPYVRSLRRFSSLPSGTTNALELSDVGSNGDFAAILHAGNSSNIQPRSVVIWQNRAADPTFISIYSRHYEPLQYPVLFPHGTPGWGLSETATGQQINTLPLTQRQWYRARVLTEPRFLIFGRLACEYLCDMYSRVEEERLNFIRGSKSGLAAEEPDEDDNPDSENIDLPASFLGSRKWASEQTADSLALARTYGPPSFFVTMTCNPDWPEIKSKLQPGQNAFEIPTIVTRAFKMRLQRLVHLLKTKMGTIVYITTSNEFQKRGYPHSHIIIKVRCNSSCVVHMLTRNSADRFTRNFL